MQLAQQSRQSPFRNHSPQCTPAPASSCALKPSQFAGCTPPCRADSLTRAGCLHECPSPNVTRGSLRCTPSQCRGSSHLPGRWAGACLVAQHAGSSTAGQALVALIPLVGADGQTVHRAHSALTCVSKAQCHCAGRAPAQIMRKLCVGSSPQAIA